LDDSPDRENVMSFAHAVAYFSWPLMALGVTCFVILRRRKVHGLPPSNLIGLIAVVSVSAPFLLVFLYGKSTTANLLVENLTFILVGLALSLLLPLCKQNSSARAAGLFGAGMMLLGTYNVSGDFIRDRAETSGIVTRKYVTHGYRGSINYHVVINDRSFPTTADLYDRINPASRIKVLTGRASGTIFDATALP
jgi:hypothetical protein